jgi:energy-coupling factor transporter ATP-binding protein EcfA2
MSEQQGQQGRGVWFEGGGFTIGTVGILATGKDGSEYVVHHWPVCPVEKIQATDDRGETEAFTRVRFLTQDGTEQTATVRTSELTNWGGEHPMTKAGWPLPPAGSKRTKAAEAVLYALRFGNFPARSGFSFAGWAETEGGRKVLVRPGSEQYTGELPPMTGTKGSARVWADTLAAMAQDSPLFALLLAVAFGSYLRGITAQTGELSFIVEIFGDPGTGKTTLLNALASIETAPRKSGGCVIDSDTTKVGLEFSLWAHNHGFLCIDELDKVMNRPEGTDRLMTAANSGGRLKGNARGGMDVGKTWDATIIGTGNSRLTDRNRGHEKAEALASRLVEFNVMDPELRRFTPADRGGRLPEWLADLAENHGHGLALVSAAVSENAEEWRGAYREALDELRSAGQWAHFRDSARLAEFTALAAAGALLAGAVVGEAAEEAATAAVEIFKNRYKRPDDAEGGQAEAAALDKLDLLRDFIANNAGRFRWEGFAWHDNKEYQESVARDLSAEAARFGAYGVVKQSRPMNAPDDIDGLVFLSPQGEKAMEQNGGLSPHTLIQAADRLGLLEKNTGGANQQKRLSQAMAAIIGKSRATVVRVREMDLAEAVAIREEREGKTPPPLQVARPIGHFAAGFAIGGDGFGLEIPLAAPPSAAEFIELPEESGDVWPDELTAELFRDEDIPL